MHNSNPQLRPDVIKWDLGHEELQCLWDSSWSHQQGRKPAHDVGVARGMQKDDHYQRANFIVVSSAGWTDNRNSVTDDR